jgi:hypothetical protein
MAFDLCIPILNHGSIFNATAVDKRTDTVATMVETVWKRLTDEWDAPPISVSKLAKALNVTFQAAAKVRDGGGLSRDNNLLLAKKLNLSPSWLAYGKGPKRPPSGEEGEPTLEASLWCLAAAAEQINDVEKRVTIANLLRLVITDPAENAADQIPIIARRLSGGAADGFQTEESKAA